MRPLVILSLLSLIGVIKCRPQTQLGQDIPVQTQLRTEPSRKNGALKDTVDILSKQLIETNITDFTRDTRTPPRIKLQQRLKKPAKAEIEEISHMGVAEPIDVDKFMETTTKLEPKTTTDSGLSTWILLSENAPTTTKPPRKNLTKTAVPMVTVKFVEKTTKPKTTTTRKPTTTTKRITTTKETTTTTPEVTKQTTKIMTKVKASVLNNALNNKTKTTTPKPKTTTPKQKTTTAVVTTPKVTTTTESKTTIETSQLKAEAKIVDLELLDSRETSKKPAKRPNNNNNANKKKKKNPPNRRRKPEENQKTKTNATKVATKEKPISTQFYNYLSREVMPTVGVGLVGLVVTAGLASYFLFPFASLRRNYEGALDRKDDHSYDTYFSDGELEQDVIGKMIEGGYEYNTMSNSVYQPYGRYEPNKYDRYISERQKETEYTVGDNKYENKYVLGSSSDSFVPVKPAVVPEHGPRYFEQENQNSTSVPSISELGPRSFPEKNNQKFVVGNVPKEYVPPGHLEHGPRSLRIRRNVENIPKLPKKKNGSKKYKSYIPRGSRVRRNVPELVPELPKDQENEITSYKDKFNKYKLTKYAEINASKKNTTTTTEATVTEKNETTTVISYPEPTNFFTFLRNVFEMKVRIGLNFLLNTTDTLSKYLRNVQEKVETVIKENRERYKKQQ